MLKQFSSAYLLARIKERNIMEIIPQTHSNAKNNSRLTININKL
ncbi:hypothetical protein [Pedobacter jejuensis]|nr:hypothetical protein [Pedobacter jejuensis]